MALDAKRYFQNAMQGLPGAGADTDITETHATPRFAVGTHMPRGDGNIYVYAYTDSATAAGTVVAPVFANSGISTTDNSVIASSAAVSVPAEAPLLAGALGSHYIQFTKSGIAVNQLVGGYLITEDGSGRGFAYRIRGNTATGNPASGDILIQLYERIKVAVSPNTDVTIVPSPWNCVTAASSATDFAVSGVLCATTTSALPYAWVCTHGTVAALQDGTVVAGDQITLSVTTSGAVSSMSVSQTGLASLGTAQILGFCMQTGASTEFASVYLQIE